MIIALWRFEWKTTREKASAFRQLNSFLDFRYLIIWVHQRPVGGTITNKCVNVNGVVRRKLPNKKIHHHREESSNFTSQNKRVPFHFVHLSCLSIGHKNFCVYKSWTYFTNLCHFRTRSVDKAFALICNTNTFATMFSAHIHTHTPGNH